MKHTVRCPICQKVILKWTENRPPEQSADSAMATHLIYHHSNVVRSRVNGWTCACGFVCDGFPEMQAHWADLGFDQHMAEIRLLGVEA